GPAAERPPRPVHAASEAPAPPAPPDPAPAPPPGNTPHGGFGSGPEAPPGPPPAPVSGRVVYGPDGSAVEGVLVRFFEVGCNPFGAAWVERGRQLTGADGGFRFAPARSGPVRAEAEAYGNFRVPFRREGEAGAAASSFLEIEIPGRVEAELEGTVAGHDHRPLPGVDVSVRQSRGSETWAARTDERGDFRIPGLWLGLPRPAPRPSADPETTDEIVLWGARTSPGDLTAAFSHSAHLPCERPVRFDPELPAPQKVRMHVQLARAGRVEVRLQAVGKGPADGATLRYRIQISFGNSTAGEVRVESGRAVIPVPHEGRLLLPRGLVGEYWIDETDLGPVSGDTNRTDASALLVSIPWHEMEVLDTEGGPLDPARVRIETEYRVEGYCAFSPSLADGRRLRVPLFAAREGNLRLEGWGFLRTDVAVDPVRPPAAVRLRTAAPLLTGTIEVPPGAGDRVRLKILVFQGDLYWGEREERWSDFDPATGSFRVLRPAVDGVCRRFAVELRVPGRKPWSAVVEADPEDPPRIVAVRFEEQE
ncbi:MAG: carboxypeptidase-like regulatory domain-containing protein, partial [Planctomycetes bacterium]|nr:carboxypeptidase-like regulatory domain-containing protein [Planctomycetota bacterium]